MERDSEISGSLIDQVDEVEQQLLFCLNRYWGYKSFKHGQLEVCKNILTEKRDCFVSMATGSGKSLMFQLPAVTMREFGTPCISLVISPLLSLIEDQISALLSMGIPACSLATPEMERMVMDGVPVVVYTTPEKLQMWKHNLNVLHHKTPILSVAIDESHCVSEWGHDFRQEYRLLSVIREELGPGVPIIALTASATPTVVEDIIQQLQLTNNVLKISSGLNRPNLKYIVKNKSSVEDVVEIVATYRQRQLRQEAQSQQLTVSQLDPDAIPYPTTLIYVNSKKLCEEVAHYLVQSSLLSGIQVAYYHADMTLEERYCVHRGFINNEIQVIVSTTAFGMGINKADVRLVIHYGLALSVEGYYQQTGRAGRDQQKSYCYLLWSLNDINSIYHLIKDRPGGQKSVEYMMDYARGRWPCRRQAILQYFGESASPPNSNNSSETINSHCCDLCDQRRYDLKRQEQLEKEQRQRQLEQQQRNVHAEDDWLESKPDRTHSDTPHANNNMDPRSNNMLKMEISKEIYMLLHTIHECGGFYGLNVPVNILLGRHDKSTQQIFGFTDKKFFGEGKHRSAEWWKALARDLVMEHFIYDAHKNNKDNHRQTVLKMCLLETTTRQRAGKYSYQAFQVSEQGKRYLAGDSLFPNSNSTHTAKAFHVKPFHPVLHKLPTENIEFSSEFLHHHKLCNQKLLTGASSHSYDPNLAAQSRFAADLLPTANTDNNSSSKHNSNHYPEQTTSSNEYIKVKVEILNEETDRLDNKRPRYDALTAVTAAASSDATVPKRFMTFEDLPPLSPLLTTTVTNNASIDNNNNSSSNIAADGQNNPINGFQSPKFSLSTQSILRIRDGLLSDLQQRSLLPHRVVSQEEMTCLSDFVSTYRIADDLTVSLEDHRQRLRDTLLQDVLCWDELHASVALSSSTTGMKEDVGVSRWQELCRVKRLFLDRVVHQLLPSDNVLRGVPQQQNHTVQPRFSLSEDILGKSTTEANPVYMSRAIAGGGSYGRSAEYIWKEQEKQRLSVYKPLTQEPLSSTTMKKSFSLYRPNYDAVPGAEPQPKNIPQMAMDIHETEEQNSDESVKKKRSQDMDMIGDDETMCDEEDERTYCSLANIDGEDKDDQERDEEEEDEEEEEEDRDIFAVPEETGHNQPILTHSPVHKTNIDQNTPHLKSDHTDSRSRNDMVVDNCLFISQESHIPKDVIDAYLSFATHPDHDVSIATDMMSTKPQPQQFLSDDALFSPQRFQSHQPKNETVDTENLTPETRNRSSSSNSGSCYEFTAGVKAMRKKSLGIAGTLGKRFRSLP